MEFYYLLPLTILLLCLPPCLPVSFCGDSSKSFEVWGDHCYYVDKGYATFDAAQANCKKWNSQLASIHSAEESKYIHKKYYAIGYQDFWIGMRKYNRSKPTLKDNYIWLDGTKVDFEKWAPGEPNDRTNVENCVMVYRYGGYAEKWNDLACSNSYKGYACKAPVVRGWQEYNGYQYYISSMPDEINRSWYESRDWCMKNGADLASILTTAEITAITGWAQKNDFKGELWMGLNRLDRKGWKWSDNNQFAVDNWKEGQPKKGKYGNLCGYQKSSDKQGKWFNGHCDLPKGFICKRMKTDNPTPKTTAPTQRVDGFCPAGYTGLDNKCLKVVLPGQRGEQALTFDEALTTCRQGPGSLPTLASIHSGLEQAFLDAHLTKYGLGVWMGLRRETFGAAWTWTDSSPFEYSHWREGAPEEHRDHHCGEAWTEIFNHGQWNNINCKDKRGYVCQTYKDPQSPIKTSPVPPTKNYTCPTDFTPYFYGCFRYEKTPLTYDLALDKCKESDQSAELVGIHFEAENAAIHTIARHEDTDVWIGFRDNMNGGEYVWGDGWAVLYTNWARGQPVKEEGGGCVKMSPDGTWSDTICAVQKPSVCKISKAPALTTPAPLDGRCPSGTAWFKDGAYCYLFVTNMALTWKDAREYCQRQDIFSELTSIHTYTENKLIHDKLTELGGKESSVWIGLYRSEKETTQMKWSDNTFLQFEAWAPHEPNGEENNENCVEMWNSDWPQKWNDVACSVQRPFVCKALKRPHFTLPTLSPHCDPGWTWDILSGKCYLMNPSVEVSYPKAQRICELNGAVLAIIHDFIQNNFIRNAMRAAKTVPYHGFWIGMTATKNDAGVYEFHWTDGSETRFENWKESPTDASVKPCVEMLEGGSWVNRDCSTPFGYVCMKAKKPPIEEPGNGLSGGQVAGIVIGVLLGVALLVVAIVAVLVHQQVIENPASRFTNGLRTTKSPGLESTISYEKTP